MANLIVRKNVLMDQEYHVAKYALNGEYIGAVAGMGRNKNTWDTAHSKRTAQRYAAILRKEQPSFKFCAEPQFY